MGPYIKDSNNLDKIIRNILISVVPFIIYKLYLTGLVGFLLLFVSCISTVICNVMIDYIQNTKKIKIISFDNFYSLLIGIIIWLLVPNNTPFVVLFLTNIISILAKRFIRILNPIVISLFSILIYLYITKIDAIYSPSNMYVLIGISLFIIIFMMLNKAIKFRIMLTFLLINILSIIFKINSNEIFIILIMGLYVIPELFSSPTLGITQYIYGIVLGTLNVFLPIIYFLPILLILNMIFIFIDTNIAFYISSKS